MFYANIYLVRLIVTKLSRHKIDEGVYVNVVF
jgi:hypothetical protein